MEVASSADRKPLVFIYEALGTMLFVYSILLTGNPISISFSLFASIILFGSITGGHFNPAVSTAVFVWNRKYGYDVAALLSACNRKVLDSSGVLRLHFRAVCFHLKCRYTENA